MKLNVEFMKYQQYRRTQRCRRLNGRSIRDVAEIEITEVTEDEFPLAFITRQYTSVYVNAESYEDFTEGGQYMIFPEEIRTFAGKLYKPVRITHGAAISTCFKKAGEIAKELYPFGCCPNEEKEAFTEESVIVSDNTDACIANIRKMASLYIVCNGIFWKICHEPGYRIMTFGTGHNHGGTGFFIDDYLPDDDYRFNALEREEAVTFGMRTALERGDTKSADGMEKNCMIDVLMPEMVTARKQPRELSVETLTLPGGKIIIAPKTVNVLSCAGGLDELEYTLWNVIQEHLALFGIATSDNTRDQETVKKVQECILDILKGAGVNFQLQ